MHQERNVTESIISTCMDFRHVKARKDLAKICNRPTLELTPSGGKPRAPFCLKPQERKEVLRYMKNFKFPDGYAIGKLIGLKAHDYYIIMERLVPVMFRGYLPDGVWSVLSDLSYFYRQLCAKEIKKEVMEKLEKDVPVLICKMEKKNFSWVL
ncbi:hypothetical protein U9M48_027422 [Paspalum notatum var. saurae]|uniref:Uncharacterized protein n=1 Tax=Paspalum notatum var. saurae TaxID=547442 RepID=A0AAQ3TX87_PASNO